jgi:poly(3-hydroxybutyrate) depolymerase
VVAVCQPTIPVLMALSIMAAEDDPAQPLSMTLMGGPIDVRAAPTAVSQYADKHPIEWFRDNVTMTVPPWYAGAGQRVYPGFMQLTGFMLMNPEKHKQSHVDLFHSLRRGDDASAAKVKEFYDEYLAVCDLPAAFYLQTVEEVFKKQSLARGTMTWHGKPVDPSKISKTALLTVEGALDDIAAPGQTLAAHGLLSGLNRSKHYHYLQEGAGHYGIFNGSRWRAEIAPRLEAFVRKAASDNGLIYDPILDDMGNKKAIKNPPLWDGRTPVKPLSENVKAHNDNTPKKSDARGTGLG